MSAPLQAHASGLLETHSCRGVKPEHLAEVLETASMQKFRDGDAIITEGDSGDLMYFLLDGGIRIQRRDPRGKMRELAVMKAPSLVGHMSLVDRSPRSASCIAMGKTVCASLDRRKYDTLLTETSARGMALRRLLLASLTKQLADANSRIRGLIEGEAKRVAAPAAGTKQTGTGVGEVEDFDVSHTDILKVAGVLEGWDISADGTDDMEFVYTEEQKRNPRNRK